MISLTKNQQEVQGKSKGNFLYFMTHIVYSFMLIYDLAACLGGARSKELACQCRRYNRHGFNTGLGKFPWRMEWQPTPIFLPAECYGQRSPDGYSS